MKMILRMNSKVIMYDMYMMIQLMMIVSMLSTKTSVTIFLSWWTHAFTYPDAVDVAS
jgi:hypothetical protein